MLPWLDAGSKTQPRSILLDLVLLLIVRDWSPKSFGAISLVLISYPRSGGFVLVLGPG